MHIKVEPTFRNIVGNTKIQKIIYEGKLWHFVQKSHRKMNCISSEKSNTSGENRHVSEGTSGRKSCGTSCEVSSFVSSCGRDRAARTSVAIFAETGSRVPATSPDWGLGAGANGGRASIVGCRGRSPDAAAVPPVRRSFGRHGAELTLDSSTADTREAARCTPVRDMRAHWLVTAKFFANCHFCLAFVKFFFHFKPSCIFLLFPISITINNNEIRLLEKKFFFVNIFFL